MTLLSLHGMCGDNLIYMFDIQLCLEILFIGPIIALIIHWATILGICRMSRFSDINVMRLITYRQEWSTVYDANMNDASCQQGADGMLM